ncbi:MAG: CBS domain-containing protein [Acidobacteriota bacterium]
MNHISHVLAKKGNRIETIEPKASVLDAVQRMNDRRIGSLIVCERDVPIGIFTERDVLMRVVAVFADPRTTLVERVMTRDLVTIAPDTTIAEAMALITHRRCRHLPVVDGGRLIGLVSSGDLTAWLVRDQQQTIYDLHDYITH